MLRFYLSESNESTNSFGGGEDNELLYIRFTLSKYIAPILQNCIDKNNINTYYEPFVGGANMIDKINCSRRIGNDIHPQLIALFKKLQAGWIPPMHISEEEYNRVRENKELYPDYYVGLVGFNATFGSKYFGGYERGFKADKVTPRDIPNEAIRNLMSQLSNIMDVEFLCGNYLENKYSNIKNSVIYCDSPYQGTTKYATDTFDYELFWNWCRRMSKYNFVFISEYNAPEDFESIWQKEVTTSLKVHKHEDRVEKLFIYKP